MYIARKSNHIEEDLKRGWSSWNFGEDGFEGTWSELQDFLASATDTNSVQISGWEVWPGNRRDFQFGELYPNYWVAIDNVNARGGLSAIELAATNEEDAIAEAASRSDYWGDGISFDPSNAKFVASVGDVHVFQI
jgi:hypothetical protein